MRAVVWSDDAIRDFEAAISYIARESRAAASLIADRIETSIDQLADIPTGHPGRVGNTYEKLVQRTPYIIAYALSDRQVTIVRIIHGSRDWPDGEWPAVDA